MDQRKERQVKNIAELNSKHLDQISALTTAHEVKMDRLANEYEARLDKKSIEYESRLNMKDSRINEIVDQTYKAIHDFKSVLHKQNDLIVSVRTDVQPIKQMQPFIASIAEKIDQLVNLEKK